MIDVAVLGAAHAHVEYALAHIAQSAGIRLVACAEPDAAMRRQFLSAVDVPIYNTVEELLSRHRIDAALVAGVYAERADAVLAALGAGAHVIADKPLCTTLDQLDQISEAAATTGLHVSAMFEKRFYPTTRALERLIDDGVLGKLALIAATGPHKLNQSNRPAWFWDGGYGGIAGDLPVHDIDLVLHLARAESGTVSALTGNARQADHPDFDDHVAVLLRAGDVAATIEANWLSPQAAEIHGHYRMRVTGSEGTAELDWAYETLTVATHDRNTFSVELGQPIGPAAYFFDALASGAEPEITTAATLLATRVALLAGRSADQGGVQLEWSESR